MFRSWDVYSGVCAGIQRCVCVPVYVLVVSLDSASDSLKSFSYRDGLEDLLMSVEVWSLLKVNADILGRVLF